MMDKKLLASELMKIAGGLIAIEKERRPQYRKAYYTMSGGLYAFLNAAKEAGDKDIMDALADVSAEVDNLRRKLDSKYIWD